MVGEACGFCGPEFLGGGGFEALLGVGAEAVEEAEVGDRFNIADRGEVDAVIVTAAAARCFLRVDEGEDVGRRCFVRFEDDFEAGVGNGDLNFARFAQPATGAIFIKDRSGDDPDASVLVGPFLAFFFEVEPGSLVEVGFLRDAVQGGVGIPVGVGAESGGVMFHAEVSAVVAELRAVGVGGSEFAGELVGLGAGGFQF